VAAKGPVEVVLFVTVCWTFKEVMGYRFFGWYFPLSVIARLAFVGIDAFESEEVSVKGDVTGT